MADVIVCATGEAMAERAAQDFAHLVSETLANAPRMTIALAGGQTPKLFYQQLAKEPYKSQIPWSRLWFFWGDERCVPKEHSESNFRMASEALLQYVPVMPGHVFRMVGEDPPPVAARAYETQLKEVFKTEQPWPAFDLILLGLGPDGHTASLMPDTPALGPGDRWVVGNVVRNLQTVRITLTLPVINHARHVWFLVSGAKKHEIFARVQEGPNAAYPASLVTPVSGDIHWYVDKAVVEPHLVS